MEKKRAPSVFKFSQKPHIMIVEGRFYNDIADKLLQGAKAVLDRAEASYEVFTVPGSFEVPAAIVYALKSLNFDASRRRFDGYVALGCVLKGATAHAEIVGQESTRALQEVILRYALAAGNAILTCDTITQALERADPSRQDRGGAAAEACLHMIGHKNHFRLSPQKRWVAR